MKLASALDQPQDSCLGCRLALLLKFTFGPFLLHFDDIGARGGFFDDNDCHDFHEDILEMG